ncbi:MAG: hypothetical protein H6658_05785 [Ardenticatenaceae bacterium]|nr:hypothetical protein [Ardenticatenaceae bacterium]
MTTTLTIYPKSLPWKERIIFKTLLLEWLTTTSPVDWQIYYQANSNAENELTVYRVEWKSFNHLRIEVDAVGVHYQKGRQHQTFDWSKIEVASLEFYRNQFSFWVDGYRAQIRFRKLNQEQIDDLFHILQKQLREHRIPYEVKMPV